ncbi:MAG: hypothetical protein Q9160_008609 [Pyrenula sp. 1 TL-2023]
MVPAVIESLQSWNMGQHIQLHGDVKTADQESKCQRERTCEPLRSPVKVVATEADEACAAYSKDTGATILTNDSDLLIYDLGEKGSVIKLNTIEYKGQPEHAVNEKLINALRWRPGVIAQKLQISGINRLAFARSRDPYSSYANILQCARQQLSNAQKDDFIQFSEEYSLALSNSSAPPELDKLDPRISELFLQIKHPTHNATRFDVPHIYLPVLLENPARTCSWTYGAGFRRLAYSLLTLSVPALCRPAEIIEHQRRGARIAAVALVPLSQEETVSELGWVENMFSSAFASSNCQRTSSAFWVVFGFLEASRRLKADDKMPISQEWIIQFLASGRLNSPFTWDDLHAYTNAQAVLYSLRLLKQILFAVRDSLPPELSRSAARAQELLDDLPNLCSLACSLWEIARDSRFDDNTAALIGDMYSLVADVDE